MCLAFLIDIALHCMAILCRRFTHSVSVSCPLFPSPLPLGISTATEKVVSLSLRGLTVCLIAQPQPQSQHRLSFDLTWLDFLETSVLYWPFRPCPSHTLLPHRCYPPLLPLGLLVIALACAFLLPLLHGTFWVIVFLFFRLGFIAIFGLIMRAFEIA